MLGKDASGGWFVSGYVRLLQSQYESKSARTVLKIISQNLADYFNIVNARPFPEHQECISSYVLLRALVGNSNLYRRFTRARVYVRRPRADRPLPPGCYGNLIVNVKRGQSRPKRACGVDPDRHDWATFTFTVIAEVRSCCTEMTKQL